MIYLFGHARRTEFWRLITTYMARLIEEVGFASNYSPSWKQHSLVSPLLWLNGILENKNSLVWLVFTTHYGDGFNFIVFAKELLHLFSSPDFKYLFTGICPCVPSFP